MMKVCLLLFISALLSIACKDKTEEIPADGNSANDTTGTLPENSKTLSYLALGDSYTIGQSVGEPERWPNILAKDLLKQNIKLSKPEIVATTGWTTTDLLYAVDRTKAKTYDMVSMLIGVNNQFQGQPAAEFRKPFHDLLLKCIGLANGKSEKVFVLSIPDWSVSSYASSFDRKKISMEIDQFNAVAREECFKEKIIFIDITDISRTALNDPSLLASDGLHFSGKMHQLWVNAVIPQMKSVIEP